MRFYFNGVLNSLSTHFQASWCYFNIDTSDQTIFQPQYSNSLSKMSRSTFIYRHNKRMPLVHPGTDPMFIFESTGLPKSEEQKSGRV